MAVKDGGLLIDRSGCDAEGCVDVLISTKYINIFEKSKCNNVPVLDIETATIY